MTNSCPLVGFPHSITGHMCTCPRPNWYCELTDEQKNDERR